jgi:hypothetical protein
MKIAVAVGTVLLTAAGASAQINKSVYTSTKTSTCKTIESRSEEGGSYIGQCSGVGAYKIQLLEGDIRQTINVIAPPKKKFELNFWGFFPGFSYVGEKIEWRTKAGVPIALIARYNVADPGDPKKSTSYLMVAKLGLKSSCVTDIVAPIANQNGAARALADVATLKPCKSAE